MNLSKLHSAIAAVCPIHGVSVGDVNDKNTWVVSFKDESTPEQRLEAQTIIDNADFSIVNDVTYIPIQTIINRLIAIDKAEIAWGALTIPKQLRFITLKEGVAIDDAEVTELLTSLGIDASTILY